MKNTMTTTKRNHLSLDECMDIIENKLAAY